MGMVEAGTALCVPGNHDMKLKRKLEGKDVRLTHGLAESVAQLEKEPLEFVERVTAFLDSLVSHYVLDSGRLVVAHAGMRADMQGRGSGPRARLRALRRDDRRDRRVRPAGALQLGVGVPRARDGRLRTHARVAEPEWLNRTINVDTGCVFGGSLTALRYPEKELVSVKAERTWYEPRASLPA